MSTLSSQPACPQCGAPLPEYAPAGLCPRCLMALNLLSETRLGGEAAGAPSAPLPPEALAPYFPQLEIFECLGRGGMGVVYKARQKSLNRLVALKLLAPERVRDPQFAERFAREARALAALNHPNIVTVYDFGQAGGFYFLLMEFVDGVNLRQLLRTRKFSPEEALAIVPPLCEALQYAHNRGIVHRDIKPENLLLDKEGRVKVADFGIARMLGNGADSAGETAAATPAALDVTHLAGGTPGYMAPEQTTTPQRVDSRADIYSLGVVFYEMLTGELPGRPIEPPSRKVHIDVRLDEIVLRALEQSPERRYQHASELKTMVETMVTTPAQGSVSAPAAPTGATSTIPPRVSVGTDDPPIREPSVATPTRFSRTAIVGACWAPLFFIAFLMAFGHLVPAGEYHGPTWWQYLLMFTFLPLGITAPFGTTILGCVSLMQIRRSAGKLYGLGLALFDALLFPLLALDGVIWSIWPIVIKMLMGSSFNTSRYLESWNPVIAPSLINEWATVATVVTAVIVNVLIIRWAWRAAKRPMNQMPTLHESNQAESGAGADATGSSVVPSELPPRFSRTAIIVLCLVGVLSIFFPVWSWVHHDASSGPAASRVVIEQRLQKEIQKHLEARSERFASLSVVVLPDLNTALVSLTGLQEMQGIDGKNAWVDIEGALDARYIGGGNWMVQGDGRLGAVQFTIAMPHLMESVVGEYKTVGFSPMIDRATVGANKAVMEGQATAGCRIAFFAGERNNGWSCAFPEATRFTATLESGLSGLRCRVVDAAGKEVLTLSGTKQIGTAKLGEGSLVFRAGKPVVEPDGAVIVADWISKSGKMLPVGVKLDAAGQTPSVVSSDLSFGPVIERVVPYFSGIDFLSGRVMEWPAEWRNMNRTGNIEEEDRWIVDTGIAATAEDGELLGHGTVATPCHAAFDEATPQQAVVAVNGLTLEKDGLREMKTGYPVTLFFRIREGGIGILQITGVTENPRGVRIRYKLVQPATHDMPVTATRVRHDDAGQGPFTVDIELETMQNVVAHLHQQYDLNVCLEWLDFEQGKDSVSLGQAIRVLEAAAKTHTLSEMEATRLAMARKELAAGKSQDMAFDGSPWYSWRFQANSADELLAGITRDTPYTWRRIGQTYVILPRAGSLLQFQVTLNTAGLSVAQAVQKILDRGPGIVMFSNIMVTPSPPEGCEEVSESNTRAPVLHLKEVPALDALCLITSQAVPRFTWDIAGFKGGRNLGLQLRGWPWGEATEGLQARLSANCAKYRAGMVPGFRADVRNLGTLDVSVAQAQQLCELELDGRWYQWVGEIAIKSSSLPPGRRYNPIDITLGKEWQTKDGQPLELAPGKHILRVAFYADAARNVTGVGRIRFVSNPLEFEVVDAKPLAGQAWGEAVEGVAVRVAADRTAWTAGEVPMLRLAVRNQGAMIVETSQDDHLHQVEVDGRWYRAVAAGGAMPELAAGGAWTNVAVELSTNRWVSADVRDLDLTTYAGNGYVVSTISVRERLNLTPGVHTVRVAIVVLPARAVYGKPAFRVVSPPITLQIGPPADKPAVRDAARP